MFDDSKLYPTGDPDLEKFAPASTLASWRHEGRGPAYVKFGKRIMYRGEDLNRFIEEHRIVPENRAA